MRAARIVERLLYTVPVMVGVALFAFLMIRLTPGDPVDILLGQSGAVSHGEIEQLRAEFNLDKPIPEQLGIYFGDLARGDLGYSYVKKVPVTSVIGEKVPATVELAGAALLVALAVAVPVGVLSALRPGSVIDRASMGAAFLGISMPGFWLGIVLILLFSVRLGWFPVGGRISIDAGLDTKTGFYLVDSVLTGNWTALRSSIRHLVLPAVTLAAPMAAIVARVLRASMIDTLQSDYVELARAKGASEFRVVVHHGLRNALIPTITVVGLQIGVLLGGNMIVETVFGWPGLGRTVVDAIFDRDFPLIQGAVMLYAMTFVVANLAVDIAYTYLNPKIAL